MSECHGVTDPAIGFDPVTGVSPSAKRALNDMLGGGAASILTVTFGLSYALLIFAGPLSPYLSYGIAATFISSAVLAAVIALGSSLPFAIAAPDSSTAAVTGNSGGLAGRAHDAADPSAPLLAPVLITLGLSTVLTGVVLCGLGLTRLGRAIRYVPYPVVGGFLGATGLLSFWVRSGSSPVTGAIRNARPVRQWHHAVRNWAPPAPWRWCCI